MDKVILIKTVGGEFYIGFNKTDTDNYIVLEDPRAIVMQMTMSGQPTIAATPVVPFAINNAKTITVYKNSIICIIEESDINKELLNGYKTEITGIVTASKPGLII